MKTHSQYALFIGYHILYNDDDISPITLRHPIHTACRHPLHIDGTAAIAFLLATTITLCAAIEGKGKRLRSDGDDGNKMTTVNPLHYDSVKRPPKQPQQSQQSQQQQSQPKQQPQSRQHQQLTTNSSDDLSCTVLYINTWTLLQHGVQHVNDAYEVIHAQLYSAGNQTIPWNNNY